MLRKLTPELFKTRLLVRKLTPVQKEAKTDAEIDVFSSFRCEGDFVNVKKGRKVKKQCKNQRI